MNTDIGTKGNIGPRLKESQGWFAAGNSFKRALSILSDGAFKLFAHIALGADRRTGRFEAKQKDLAADLGKSRRAIGKYIVELEEKQVCRVLCSKNQYALNKFEILDPYWPYERIPIVEDISSREDSAYVAAVRDIFLGTGCTRGTFGASDTKTARNFRERGASLRVVQEALSLGACRKYDSWLNGGSPERIASLRYFEPLVAEIQEHPIPDGYSQYLNLRMHKLAKLWREFQQAEAGPNRSLAKKGNNQKQTNSETG